MIENRLVGNSEKERIVNTKGDYKTIAITGLDTYTYTSLEIITPPALTNYFEGDLFNPDELVCDAIFTGIRTGEQKTITLFPSDLTIKPNRPLTIEDTNIEIAYTYEDITHTVTYPITVAPAIIYTITGNITNGTYRAPATAKQGEIVTFNIDADEGYILPNSLDQFTIEGANGSYNSNTGILLLSNIINNVTVTVTCPEKPDFINPWTDEEMNYFVDTWSGKTTAYGTYNLNNAPMGFGNQTDLINATPEYVGKYIYSFTIPMRCRLSSSYSNNMTFTWGIIKRNLFAQSTPSQRVSLSSYVSRENNLTLPTWNTVELKTFVVDKTIEADEMLWFGTSTDTITPIINQGPTSSGAHPGKDFTSHFDSYALWFGNTTPSASGNYVQPIQFTTVEPEQKTLIDIEIATPPTTTTYAVGTVFNPAGLVVNAKYKGNDSGIIYTVENVAYTYEPTGPLTLNDTEVVITFTDDEITRIVKQSILVTETSFSISGNITNGTLTGDTEIAPFGNAWVSITPDNGYVVPSDLSNVNVENATVTEYTNGMLAIVNPTGNVVITASCPIEPGITDLWTEDELAEFFDEFNGQTTPNGTYNPANTPFAIGSVNTYPAKKATKFDGNVLKGYNIHSITMPFRCRQSSNYSSEGMTFTWGILKTDDFSKTAAQRAAAMTNVHQVNITLSSWNHVENKEIIIDYTLQDDEYLALGVSTDTVSPLLNQSSINNTAWKTWPNHKGYFLLYGATSLTSGNDGVYVQPMVVTLN